MVYILKLQKSVLCTQAVYILAMEGMSVLCTQAVYILVMEGKSVLCTQAVYIRSWKVSQYCVLRLYISGHGRYVSIVNSPLFF
jgi:hypothetical protein